MPHRRVLVRDPGEGLDEQVALAHRGRLDRLRDDRLVAVDPLEEERVGLVREGVAGARLLEPRDREELPGAERRHALLLRGVHREDAPDLLEPPLRRVPDRVAFRDPPGVDPDEHVPPLLVEE